MSTDYLPWNSVNDTFPKITLDDLKKLKKGKNPVYFDSEEDDEITLTDGKNFFHACARADGQIMSFVRFGANDVDEMINFLAAKFDIEIYSEHDEEYERIMSDQAGEEDSEDSGDDFEREIRKMKMTSKQIRRVLKKYPNVPVICRVSEGSDPLKLHVDSVIPVKNLDKLDLADKGDKVLGIVLLVDDEEE